MRLGGGGGVRPGVSLPVRGVKEGSGGGVTPPGVPDPVTSGVIACTVGVVPLDGVGVGKLQPDKLAKTTSSMQKIVIRFIVFLLNL